MIPHNAEGSINFDRVFYMYKDSESRPIHNQKQYDEAEAAGFGDYQPLDYPRFVYRADGEKVKVNSGEEEAAKADEGYGRKSVVIPPKAASAKPLKEVPVPHNDYTAAILALEKRTDEQAAKIEEQGVKIDALLTKIDAALSDLKILIEPASASPVIEDPAPETESKRKRQ